MPSIAYAFPVTPCDPDRLNDWDNKIGSLIKDKFKFIKSTPTAMIREDKYHFWPRMPINFSGITGELPKL
jgi:hypothetical protein